MTIPIPVVAPNVPNYAVFNPYITPEEFLQSATGVDSSNLVRGQSREANAAALTALISRASNYADGLCHQVLCATADIQSGTYKVKGDGTIAVPLDYTPIIAVTGVSIGYRTGYLAPMTDLSGIGFRKKTVTIPAAGFNFNFNAGPMSGPAGYARCGWIHAAVSYVNGYANTTLAAAAAAGATSVTVTSPLGIFPGLAMQFYDSASSEPVTVAATYVQGSTVVPLTAPTAFAHTAGSSLSAMPPAIKFAVVKLTTWMIKTRGAASLTLDSIGGGRPKTQTADAGAGEDYDDALDALEPFMRVA